jgi:HAD superfamily hydrolase (TIGR01509 family)
MSIPITHLIVDCDGVLIDSETVALGTLVHMLLPHVPDREKLITLIRPRLGLKLEAVLLGLYSECHLPPPSTAELAHMRSHVEHECDARAQAVPGVSDALEAIPQRKAVASNSRLPRVLAALERTGLAPLFESVHTADIVGRPKPDPAVYLSAALSFAVDPAQCLVVEDSVTGVNAARAAGMRVLGFTGAGHAGSGQGAQLSAAGAIASFSDMAELPGLVAELAN